MAAALVSPSPSSLITSQLASSLPSSNRPSADHERSVTNSNTAPYTPTSSEPSGSVAHSTTPFRHQSEHRKSNSVSTPPKTSLGSAKRPLSLQHWEGRGKEVTGELSQGAPGSGMEDTQRLLGVTLPPSPPLTNREVDPEADGFDSIHTHSQTAPENEEDIATAWRTSHEQHPIPSSSTRPSHDVPRPSLKDPLRHPLEDPNPISPSSVIEFEKGQDPPQDDEDLKPVMGVTKPFEIIRPSQQPLSVPKPPKSSYYMGPPLGPSVYGTPPVGQLGLHHPREIVRIERDYDNGELVQFSSAYPMELQGRITPTVFLETINVLNETLIKAYSVSGAAIYNVLAVLTLWISPLFIRSRYDKEMERLALIIDQLNAEIYNPVGLNILWPRKSAFLFLEIEYY